MNAAPPDVLYHYTSPEAALGIVRSAEVWASMIQYMNDSSEFRLALRLVQELVSEIPSVPEATRRVISEEFVDAVRSVAVFIFSLTGERDLLSQWRAYASRGGYALGFSKELLERIAEEDGALLARCVYKEEEQRALMRPVVDELVALAADLPDVTGIDLYHSVAERFTQVAALVKDRSFEAENEWRLVFGPGIDPSKTDARTAGSIVVPFYRCPIKRGGLYPLAEIVVGPGQDVELAGRSLRYVTSSIYRWPIKVTRSDSTFRVLS